MIHLFIALIIIHFQRQLQIKNVVQLLEELSIVWGKTISRSYSPFLPQEMGSKQERFIYERSVLNEKNIDHFQ